MDSLIIYPDGTDKPGVEIPVANGFVSRVVSAVADRNVPDAQRVAKALNAAIGLADLDESLDKQTYDDIRRADFDMPDDAELNVDITAKQYRVFGQLMAAVNPA